MFHPEVICLRGGVSGVGETILELIQKSIKEKAFARLEKSIQRLK